ncbi:MAG: hypothetical protein HYU67_06660 [Flavobacteriia bacterium]|nr:hypothetical protein [Flavobacteriia bacterium]
MMKKIVFFTLTSVLFSLIIQSCGSSKGNCDAYGENSSDQKSELAAK